LNSNRREDLLIWCLIATNHHDGFVKFDVTVENTLTRGTRGAAAKRIGQDRVHPSFVLVPIQEKKEQERQQSRTMVPEKVLA